MTNRQYNGVILLINFANERHTVLVLYFFSVSLWIKDVDRGAKALQLTNYIHYLAVPDIRAIFFKGYPKATSTYTGYREDFIAERETRVANISFIYRFGKNTVAPVRKRSGGAEEEKNRAASGNS